MENKTDLRFNAKYIRKNLDMKLVSEKLVNLIRNHKFYIDAKNVMIFYPTKYEVNLLDLVKDNKNFYLPKVDGENLLVCPYDCDFKLEKSSFNIFEPCSNPVNSEVLDLIIVPALMADKAGYRLGYGGGFYDRFLKACGNSTKTITAVAKELFVQRLPHDDFDVRIDDVIFV